MNAVLPFGVMNLVGARERLIDFPDHVRNAVGWIQTLIRIHLSGVVGIGRDLPSTHINRFQTGCDLLHRLIPGQSSQRRNIQIIL